VGDPWPPDPQGDARFLAAVERMDAKLMAEDTQPRWWERQPKPPRPPKPPKVKKTKSKKLIKVQPKGEDGPAHRGKHVRARHAAKRNPWVVPLWPVLIILLLQAVALAWVLL
jgi:hypothetical protein